MTLLRMRNIIRRAKNLNDRFCYKGAAVALGTFGILSNASALMTFSLGCVYNVSNDKTNSYIVYFGPSFWMIFTGIIIKFITVLFHLLIPVPREYIEGS